MSAKPVLTPDSIGKAIRRRKDDWIDQVMKQHIPRRIYTWMQHKETRRFAEDWLKTNGYAVEHHPEGVVVVKKGDKTLAKGKFILDLDSPKDLLALAGAMRKTK